MARALQRVPANQRWGWIGGRGFQLRYLFESCSRQLRVASIVGSLLPSESNLELLTNKHYHVGCYEVSSLWYFTVICKSDAVRAVWRLHLLSLRITFHSNLSFEDIYTMPSFTELKPKIGSYNMKWVDFQFGSSYDLALLIASEDSVLTIRFRFSSLVDLVSTHSDGQLSLIVLRSPFQPLTFDFKISISYLSISFALGLNKFEHVLSQHVQTCPEHIFPLHLNRETVYCKEMLEIGQMRGTGSHWVPCLVKSAPLSHYSFRSSRRVCI